MSADPSWLRQLGTQVAAKAYDTSVGNWVSEPPADARDAAVLVLLADNTHGPDVVLLERASTLRTHAGQMAFPGGAIDPGDSGAVGAALREASEEVQLRAETVDVLGSLAPIWVQPSNFAVTPVIAHWREPHPLIASDAEVVHIVRVGVRMLADPVNRYRVRLSNGYFGPAFALDGDPTTRLIWGFTAGVVDVVLRMGGWYRSWDRTRVVSMPPVS